MCRRFLLAIVLLFAVSLSPNVVQAQSPDTAQLEVRLSTIEEQLREVRGRAEQAENEARRLNEQLTKLQGDMEFRFSQLSQGGASAAAPAPAQPAPAPTAEGGADTGAAPGSAPAAEAAPAETKQLKTSFKTPRDHYNYAFRLLNQTQYDEAAESFRQFTENHPKDALVGNAFYWQGETYFIRRDYLTAADLFRQGFEVMPEGPKAADNLYKLALSMIALDRNKEGCTVLAQVVTRFKKTATNVVNKAEQEIKKNGCRKN